MGMDDESRGVAAAAATTEKGRRHRHQSITVTLLVCTRFAPLKSNAIRVVESVWLFLLQATIIIVDHYCYDLLASTRPRSSAAAAAGESAPRIAETTAKPSAPADRHCAPFAADTPPIATRGTGGRPAEEAASAISCVAVASP